MRRARTFFLSRARRSRGFSLVELLVVIGLISVLCVSYVGGIGGGQGTALRAAQSVVAELLAAARTRAIASGAATRLLVNQGGPAPAAISRYLRCLVLQEQGADGVGWGTVAEVFLPSSVRVVPARTQTPSGLLADAESWKTGTGAVLESSALSTAAGAGAVDAYPDDTWGVIAFDGAGASDHPGGSVVLAAARVLSPGNAPQLRLLHHEEIRGVVLSRYGVPVLLNSWNEF